MSQTSEPSKEAGELIHMKGGKPMIKTPDGEARPLLTWKPASEPPVTDIKFFDTSIEGKGYEYRSRGVIGFNVKEQWAGMVYHTSNDLQWVDKEYYDGYLDESENEEQLDLTRCDDWEVDFWIDAPAKEVKKQW